MYRFNIARQTKKSYLTKQMCHLTRMLKIFHGEENEGDKLNIKYPQIEKYWNLLRWCCKFCPMTLHCDACLSVKIIFYLYRMRVIDSRNGDRDLKEHTEVSSCNCCSLPWKTKEFYFYWPRSQATKGYVFTGVCQLFY